MVCRALLRVKTETIVRRALKSPCVCFQLRQARKFLRKRKECQPTLARINEQILLSALPINLNENIGPHETVASVLFFPGLDELSPSDAITPKLLYGGKTEEISQNP
jgi:hypothetical protein